MSRGRKKSKTGTLRPDAIFDKNIGTYLEIISHELNKFKQSKNKSTDALLIGIQTEKEQLIQNRKFRINNAIPKPDILSLRYKVPTNWNWFLFSEVAFYQEGPGIRTFQYRNEGIKLLNVENITQDQLRLDLTTRFISKDEFELKYQHFKIEEGDILFASSGGSWGKTCWFKDAGFDVILNTSTMRIKSFSEKVLLNDYLYLFLKSNFFRTQLTIQLMGMQPNFGSTHFNSISIPVPPVSEQKSILNFLDDFKKGNLKEDKNYFNRQVEQKLIAIHKSQVAGYDILNEASHQIELVKLLRQAILQEAVQGKLSELGFVGLNDSKIKGGQKILSSSNLKNHSADNENAATLLQRIKAEKQKLIAAGKLKKEKELPPITEEEIPFELPKGWVWCRLGEIADIGTGATPLTSTNDYYNGNIPWITSSATGSLFVSEAEKFITEKALNETNCKVYPIGTLIVAMYGQGKTRGQITELLIEAATNQACASIELIIKENYHKGYVKYFFQKIYLEIRELAAGGAQPNLNLQKIKDTLVPLPPLLEQHRIVAKVQQLLQLVNELEQQVAHSQTQAGQLLQAVLKEAFTNKGKVYAENEMVTMAAEE